MILTFTDRFVFLIPLVCGAGAVHQQQTEHVVDVLLTVGELSMLSIRYYYRCCRTFLPRASSPQPGLYVPEKLSLNQRALVVTSVPLLLLTLRLQLPALRFCTRWPVIVRV